MNEVEEARVMARSWQEIRAQRPPREDQVAGHRARIDAEVRAYHLREVREGQGVTQVDLAGRMHITQPSISALERGEIDRAGIATIRAYVEALGGTLDVVANFGDQKIVLG
jgi:predicted transcriptional regulator